MVTRRSVSNIRIISIIASRDMSTDLESVDSAPVLPTAEAISIPIPTAAPAPHVPDAIPAVPVAFALAFGETPPELHTKTGSSLPQKNADKISKDTDVRAHTKALIDFMRQVHLEQYTEDLISKGYDDLNFLSTMSKEDLLAVAGVVNMLPGHAEKFSVFLTREVSNVSSASSGRVVSKETTSVAGSADNSYVVCIVDRSGSMRSMGNAVKTGFNEFLHEQKALPGDCMATIVRFDHEVDVVHHGVDLSDVQDATDATFRPRGGTALYDAIGKTIAMVKQEITTLASKPSRVMVLLLTDGEENGSKKYTHKKIMKKIRRCEKKLKWTFVFVGANQDAIATGTKIGFTAQNCLSYTADMKCQRAAWSNISANIQRQRLLGSANWTERERNTSLR